jgi:hypothetical protein
MLEFRLVELFNRNYNTIDRVAVRWTAIVIQCLRVHRR